MPVEPGVRIGAYEVQEFVGRGAMGVVYRAFHEGLARPAAVKVLQAMAPDPDATARFRREAQAIAQMRHPNILNVYDFGEYQGTPYMIVEYVPGGGLNDRLRGGRQLSHEDTIRMLRGIGAGLDYAHSLGVVHRDVKPANVLLGKDETPILADFGLAKLMQSSSLKSVTGVTTGTPAYMAPEQVTGSAVGPAADRYALATVAYELLTGAVPFESEGVLELLYAHVHREPPPATERKPELGPEVDAVLLRGLAKDPAARWESCADLVDSLAAALRGEASAVRKATQPVPAAAAVAATMPLENLPPPANLPAIPDSRRRTTRWLVATAVVGLLLLVLVVYVLTRSHANPAVSLSAGSVVAGDTLVVTGSGLPPNQAGTVQMESTRRQLGSFKADGQGVVSQDVRIPVDAGEGDHLVLLCWGSGCPVSGTVHVTPQPRPSPSPSPVKVFTPLVSLSTVTPKLGGPLQVTGRGFDPAREYSVVVIQGSAAHPFAGPAAAPGGAFTASGNLPAGLQAGAAEVFACIVTPGQPSRADECARQQVTISR